MDEDPLPGIEIETGADPDATVVWLHGLGADGRDFEPVVPELGLPRSLSIRFVFPHAPIRPVTLNGGMAMRAWYDIHGLDDGSPQDEAGIRASEQRLRALVGRENRRGIANRRIIVAGFSQGGAIALFSGLRFENPLAGIMGLSTYLPLHEVVASESVSASLRTPVFLGHGTQDEVVSHTFGTRSRNLLEAMGCRVTWRDYPMGHSVSAEEIRDIGHWLVSRLDGV